MNKLFLILALSVLVSAAELAYINSTPILGEADLDELMLDSGKERLLGGEAEGNLNSEFRTLYEHRPHSGDPAVPYYKLAVLGFEVSDIMKTGMIFWQLGAFNGDSFIDLEEKRPAFVVSGFHGQLPYISGCSSSEVSEIGSWGYGRRLALMHEGWLILLDMIGSNSAILLEDDVAGRLNLSREEFLDAYSSSLGTSLARVSFAESVLDERPPWSGIFYMAYYPRFNTTVIIVKAISEEELEGCSVYVDGVEVERSVYLPFVFVEKKLGFGNHTVTLSTSRGEYELSAPVSDHGVGVLTAALYDDGRMSLAFIGSDFEGNNISVDEAAVSYSGGEYTGRFVSVNGSLSKFEFDLGESFETLDCFAFDVTATYHFGGEEKVSKEALLLRSEMSYMREDPY